MGAEVDKPVRKLNYRTRASKLIRVVMENSLEYEYEDEDEDELHLSPASDVADAQAIPGLLTPHGKS